MPLTPAELDLYYSRYKELPDEMREEIRLLAVKNAKSMDVLSIAKGVSFKDILGKLGKNSTLQKDITDRIDIKTKVAAIDPTFKAIAKSPSYSKSLEDKLFSQVSDLFQQSRNAVMHRFILGSFKGMEPTLRTCISQGKLSDHGVRIAQALLGEKTLNLTEDGRIKDIIGILAIQPILPEEAPKIFPEEYKETKGDSRSSPQQHIKETTEAINKHLKEKGMVRIRRNSSEEDHAQKEIIQKQQQEQQKIKLLSTLAACTNPDHTATKTPAQQATLQAEIAQIMLMLTSKQQQWVIKQSAILATLQPENIERFRSFFNAIPDSEQFITILKNGYTAPETNEQISHQQLINLCAANPEYEKIVELKQLSLLSSLPKGKAREGLITSTSDFLDSVRSVRQEIQQETTDILKSSQIPTHRPSQRER